MRVASPVADDRCGDLDILKGFENELFGVVPAVNTDPRGPRVTLSRVIATLSG